jgi:galactose mutarotase-like enzyme
MAPRVSRTSVDGLDAVVLENDALRVSVLPALGAHVSELVDKAGGRDLLWRNPRMAPRPAPYGANFDDWWSGGWDEILPSGDNGLLHGERLPYMGEMWCVPWTAEVKTAPGVASVTTVGFGTIAPIRVERTLSLRDDDPVLTARYRITSLDVRPLPYTWGIHPVFAVTPHHRIDLPADRMVVGVSSDPSMGIEGQEYTWPLLPDPAAPDGVHDMRRVRLREDAVFGGHWATDLSAGWLALTDTAAHRGVAIAFDADVFRHAWLWQVYGGWRGHHHLALEPWSGRPQQVDEAEAVGQARVLEPGGSVDTEVSFVLFDGLDAVAAVERDEDGYRVR